MRSLRSRTWIDLLAGVSLVLSATGCTVKNPAHCGNQSGDATCRARPGGLPFCNLCEASNDGCVAEPSADPTCRPPDDHASGTAGEPSTSTDAEGTGAGDGPGDGEAGSSAEVSSSDASGVTESSDTGAPYCGNDVKEGDEACDMTDFGGQTCASVLRDSDYRGHLDCTGSCELLTVNCCLGPGAPCLPAVNECCNECVLHGTDAICN